MDKLSLTFYSTLGCHLCELAKNVVYQSANSAFFEIKTVDIANDESLLKEYGTRIPVIKDTLTDKEIAWPFDLDEFESWLT